MPEIKSEIKSENYVEQGIIQVYLATGLQRAIKDDENSSEEGIDSAKGIYGKNVQRWLNVTSKEICRLINKG